MTREELDRQIEIDKMMFFNEDAIINNYDDSELLSDEDSIEEYTILGEDLKFNPAKSAVKGVKKVAHGAVVAGTAVAGGTKKSVVATKKLALKNINMLKEKDNKQLLNGDTSQIKFVTKAVCKFAALSALVNPFIAAIAFVVSNNLGKTAKNNKRYNLYRELEADKAMVDEKIRRLHKLEDEGKLNEDKEKQLYALVKLSKKYEVEMRQLEANIKHDDSVLKHQRKANPNAYHVDDY